MRMLLPRVARVGAAYVKGNDGSNVCPANSAKIWDEPTCVAAAASVGVTSVTTQTTTNYPSGCYSRDVAVSDGPSVTEVYLNPHATGAESSDSTPLCACARPSAGCLRRKLELLRPRG
jgi:hypothetical protein